MWVESVGGWKPGIKPHDCKVARRVWSGGWHISMAGFSCTVSRYENGGSVASICERILLALVCSRHKPP